MAANKAKWGTTGKGPTLSKRKWLALSASAGAISLMLVGVSASAGASTVLTKTQWQAAIAQVPAPGGACYDASYPALQWQPVACVTARNWRFAPSKVGNGVDYSAQVSGTISKATGVFKDVGSEITEKGQVDATGSKIANAFSLQLNTEFFSGSPACSGSSDPSNCLAWQQFVYAYDGCTGGASCIFMQYWLIDYDATCPSGWFTYSDDCYTNSNAAAVSTVTAGDLASVSFYGKAAQGGNDGVSLSIGSGTATLVTGPDSMVDLAPYWNTTEWGVFGDAGGGEAYFGTDNTLEAQTHLKETSSAAPTCVKEGFTGETNNLKLASTPALGNESMPTMASRQTDGSAGTASCAVKA
jgi:hypothetical protein